MQKTFYNINKLNYFFMDTDYLVNVIIKNENIKKKHKYYTFNFKIKNNELIFKCFKPKIPLLYQISKLIIGNYLYFNINSDYYNAKLDKINYETIKRYNKIKFIVDTNNIVNIIKDNNLYYSLWYTLYFVKKDKELILFFNNNKILNVYKYINNELILQKKYIYYIEFLIDENDNLFCFYQFEILPITKKFRHYNYIVNLVKRKYYNKIRLDPSVNKDLFYLYGIYYFVYKNNNNEINLYLNYISFKTNSIKYEDNKIELIGKNEFLFII